MVYYIYHIIKIITQYSKQCQSLVCQERRIKLIIFIKILQEKTKQIDYQINSQTKDKPRNPFGRLGSFFLCYYYRLFPTHCHSHELIYYSYKNKQPSDLIN